MIIKIDFVVVILIIAFYVLCGTSDLGRNRDCMLSTFLECTTSRSGNTTDEGSGKDAVSGGLRV